MARSAHPRPQTRTAPADRPLVFIIHGRDIEARDELVKFIRSLGLEWLSFDDASTGLGPSPFIGQIIEKGIDTAAATIALFTPDEQTVLYSTSGEPLERNSDGARWQARPNVIFEAGLAYGLRPQKTILATLGGDVRLFSNLGGRRFIELEKPGSTELLRKQLSEVLGTLPPAGDPAEPVDFAALAQQRWPHYDELYELEKDLRATKVGRGGILLSDVVRKVANTRQAIDWERSAPRTFLSEVQSAFGDQVAKKAYWWLVVLGFFRFNDIRQWWDPNEGDNAWDSIGYTQFSRRALALLEKWKRLPPASTTEDRADE